MIEEILKDINKLALLAAAGLIGFQAVKSLFIKPPPSDDSVSPCTDEPNVNGEK